MSKRAEAIAEMIDDYTRLLHEHDALLEHLRVVDWSPVRNATGPYVTLSVPTDWVRELVRLVEAE